MKTLTITVVSVLCILLMNSTARGQKSWTDLGGDGLWTTATNWSGGTVPTASDDVVLDNSNIAGSYTVTIPRDSTIGTAICRTIGIGYAGNANVIVLNFQSNKSLVPGGLKFGDGASGNLDFAVDQGGVFLNASNAASGLTYIQRAASSDTLRVKSGGKLVQVTERSFSTPFPAATTRFDAGSTFELNIRGTSSATPTITGRIYGNFVIAADSANGTRTYVGGSATGGLTILDTWTIRPGVSFSSAWGLNSAGTYSIKNIDFNADVSFGSSTGNLNISGNVNASATWTTSSAQGITFNGTTTQSISGNPNIFRFITLDNFAGLTLNASITDSSLTFVNGKLTLGSNDLTMTSFGSIFNASASNYVITDGTGKFIQTVGTRGGAFIFPVGTTTSYNPVTLMGTTGTDVFSARVIASVSPSTDNDAYAVQRTWDIAENVPGSVGSVTCTFQWNGADEGVSFDRYNSVPWRNTGGVWFQDGTLVSIDGLDPYVETVDISSGFSRWTIANVDAALPIQLASFNATVISNNSVRLDWTTASELNNYGFYVQRKRAGEQEFIELPNSFVQGHGTTLDPQHYSYEDHTVSAGQWFYRLKQVDLNGAVTLSEPIQIDVVTGVQEAAPREFALHQNYPNPFNPSTEIRFSVEATGLTTLKIYNVLGQEMATLFNQIAEAGQYYNAKLDASRFASGMHFYKLKSGQKSSLKKMLLMK